MTGLLLALVLNGSWAFRFEEGRALAEAWNTDFVATDSIPVPGCFDAMPKWYMKRGTGLYRRTFTLEKAVDAAWLVVDGMGFTSRFAVDGRDIGGSDLPWSRFELATGPLAAGQHTIVAAVDNRWDWRTQKLVRPYYDFHCWGGFFHGITLSFDNRKLRVRTRDYRTGEVEVEIGDWGFGNGERTLVFDGTNEVKTTFRNGRATVKVPGFKLWSPDTPNLHTVAVDGVTARFGIRTVEARDRGIYLNGERIFLKGANRHDQHAQSGAATSETQMLEDIQLLKAMGGNFFRGAHYPQAQRFLDLCDENGVLVWEESLGWGNGQSYTKEDGIDEVVDADFIDAQVRQTRLMVENSFNHPSVIIFGFLNELASHRPEAKALADRLIDTIRAQDSGRLVTFACNMCTVDLVNERTDLVSINTYPGYINEWAGTHDELVRRMHEQPHHGIDLLARMFHEKYPDRTIIVSENGAGGRYGVHDPSAPCNSEEFQAEYNGIMLEAAYANPDIAGLAFWQFCDARTSGRDCGKKGMKDEAMSVGGLFDRYRRPKLVVRTVGEWYRNRVPANLGAVPRRAAVGEPAPVGMAPDEAAKWKLAFADEFEGAALDASAWSDFNPAFYGRPGSFVFARNNVAVKGGALTLTARELTDAEKAGDLRGLTTERWATGTVKSRSRIRYGYFEARIRSMKANVCNAFWLYDPLSDDPVRKHTAGDESEEIDIVEMFGKTTNDHCRRAHFATLHRYLTPYSEAIVNKTKAEIPDGGQRTVMPYDFWADFHVYGCKWTEESITWYVDGKEVFTRKNDHWKRPLHVMLDCEIMDSWSGTPDSADLPAQMTVDYVRVWTARD